MPFYPLLGEGSPTKIDYSNKVGTLILTSLLDDLVEVPPPPHNPILMFQGLTGVFLEMSGGQYRQRYLAPVAVLELVPLAGLLGIASESMGNRWYLQENHSRVS